MSMNLLIDTDPGVDDALAILMAHRHARVLGLTVSAGNVGLAHTVGNALKLVELLDAATPVFAGCPVPLVRTAADAAFVHGEDGFGDTGYAAARRRTEPEHAALAILRLTRAHPGQITLVALGPLTNIALALRLDPQLPQRVQRLVVMGGAVSGSGNTERIPAEFNIGFDPEAAHVVFSGWPRLTLVDWEATERHPLDLERLERRLAEGDARAHFYAAISRKTRAFSRSRGRAGLMVADALAMAVALAPEIVTRSVARRVEIELDGTLTRGATVVDWHQRSGRPANADLVLDLDDARLDALIAASLGA